MSRSRRRRRTAQAPTLVSPSVAQRNDEWPTAPYDMETRPDRTVSVLDSTLSAAERSKHLTILLREKLYDSIFERALREGYEKLLLRQMLSIDPIQLSDAPLRTDREVAALGANVAAKMRGLDTYVDLCSLSPHVFRGLPAPAAFPDGCHNTWLMEVLLSPADPPSARGMDDVASKPEIKPQTGNQDPPCTCRRYEEEQAGAGEDRKVVPAQPLRLQVSFTLWNEAASIPVYYNPDLFGDPESPIAMRNRRLSALTETMGGEATAVLQIMSPIQIGACVDFRMPENINSVQRGVAFENAPSIISVEEECGTEPRGDKTTSESSNGPPESIYECPPSSMAFFNELLLAFNIAIPQIWVNGKSSFAFVDVIQSFPVEEHLNHRKRKGKSKFNDSYDYEDDDTIPDIPQLGEFQPAKILCYDNRLASLVPFLMESYMATLGTYAYKRASDLHHLVSQEGERSRSSRATTFINKEASSKPHSSSEEVISHREEGIQSNEEGEESLDYMPVASGSGPVKERITEVPGLPEISDMEPAVGPHTMAPLRAYTTVPMHKLHSKTKTKSGHPLSAQHILICSTCGVLGVDRKGAIPWQSLMRCSRCQTAW